MATSVPALLILAAAALVGTAHGACTAAAGGLATTAWCVANCENTASPNHGSCGDLCICDGSGADTASIGCGIASCTGTSPATNSWCESTCCAGTCPGNLCSCTGTNDYCTAQSAANGCAWGTGGSSSASAPTPYYSTCGMVSNDWCTATCNIDTASCTGSGSLTTCCSTSSTAAPVPFTSSCTAQSGYDDALCTYQCNTLWGVGYNNNNPQCDPTCCSTTAAGYNQPARTAYYAVCDAFDDAWCTWACNNGVCTSAPAIGCCSVRNVASFSCLTADTNSDGVNSTTTAWCTTNCLYQRGTAIAAGTTQVTFDCGTTDPSLTDCGVCTIT